MSYFDKFPLTTYEFYSKESVVQDIFRRSIFISEYKPYTDLYSSYLIKDGETPESLAMDTYGSASYFWVILLFNEIHSMYHDWPLSSHMLEEFCAEKYGSTVMFQTKHYEKDSFVLGEVKEFKKDIAWVPPTAPGSEAVAVSFYDFESQLNDEKRKIHLLRPELLSEFVTQFEATLNE
jgi:hypothetical protein